MTRGKRGIERMIKSIKKNLKPKILISNLILIIGIVLFVTLYGAVFGSSNSLIGVCAITAMLMFVDVHLSLKLNEAIITTVLSFVLMGVSSQIASINPFLGFVINFLSIISILILTCHNVKLFNHSILVLSYLLLYGYKIDNEQVLFNRIIGLIFAGILVTSIFYIKQRKIKFENKFSNMIKDIDFNTERTKWQFKFAFVVTSSVLIGELLHIPRAMWIGIACMSIFHPDREQIEIRYKDRMKYMIIGSIIYGCIYILLPEEFRSFIGLMGGIMVGFSATYKWQVVFNAFGALAAATPILGLGGAIIFRIINNVFGALYSKGFDYITNSINKKVLMNVNEA